MISLFAMMAVQGYAMAVNAAAAAFYAADFGLDDPDMARIFGWISLGSLGTLALARLIDRIGRRRLLLASVAGMSIAALATAMAPTVPTFVAAQIALATVAGTLFATAIVIIAEERPLEERARGQSLAGIVNTVGGGLALVCVAGVGGLPGSWRWAWGVAALPILALPAIWRTTSETARFRRASERGEIGRPRMLELFGRRYRRRSVGVLLTAFLAQITVTATMSWLLYHPERELGLHPGIVTAAVLIGAGLGMVGFPLGARLADRMGRRPTVLIGGSGAVLSNIAYYWVPADLEPSPAVALAALLALGTLTSTAATVAFRAASTELFPTRLRGTLQGVLVTLTSGATVLTQFAIATLTELLGALPLAITVVALVGIPAYALFFVLVAETAGLDLEEAALEHEGDPWT
jgi:MFS family permease